MNASDRSDAAMIVAHMTQIVMRQPAHSARQELAAEVCEALCELLQLDLHTVASEGLLLARDMGRPS